MNDRIRSLLILGGGPAGLAAAWYGSRTGLEVTVLEASDTVGGNARTLEFDGFRFDTGAHRLHDRVGDVTGDLRTLLGDDLQQIDVPSAIRDRGRFVDFPLDPSGLLRHLSTTEILKAAGDLLRARLRGIDPDPNFRELSIYRYGATIADRYLLGYTRKLWGVDPAELSPEVSGGRLRGIDLRTFIQLALRRRPERTRHLDGTFLYPTRGIGMIPEGIAATLPKGSVHTGEPVTAIDVDRDRVVRVMTTAGQYPVTPDVAVVSTLPADLLVRIIHPTVPDPVLSASTGIRFRTLRLFLAGISRPALTPYASVYFPNPSIPFTRLYESTNRSRLMTPPGMTAAALELPTGPDESWYTATDDVFLNEGKRLLREEFQVSGDEIRFTRTLRIANAYPVLTVAASERIRPVFSWIEGLRNLYPLGRNQTFRYLHLHDLLRDGRALVERLSSGR